MRFCAILFFTLFLACKKPIDFNVPKKTFFFVTAYLQNNEPFSKKGFADIKVDFFNQSNRNSPFDTGIFRMVLYEANTRIKLNLNITRSQYGFGSYTYFYQSDTSTKPKPNVKYTLKLYYLGDSCITTTIMPDTIIKINDILTYYNDSKTDFKAQIIDNNISDYLYLSQNDGSINLSGAFHWKNLLEIPNSTYYIINSSSDLTGCTHPRGQEPAQPNIHNYFYKVNKKDGGILKNYANNMENEINYNPLFIHYNSDYNIQSKFAYGFFVSVQAKLGTGAKLWDQSPRSFKFQIKDKNGNMVKLNNINFRHIEYRQGTQNAVQGKIWDNNFIYLTQNELFLATIQDQENDNCGETTFSSRPLTISVSYSENSIEYATVPADFIPKNNLNATFTLKLK